MIFDLNFEDALWSYENTFMKFQRKLEVVLRNLKK